MHARKQNILKRKPELRFPLINQTPIFNKSAAVRLSRHLRKRYCTGKAAHDMAAVLQQAMADTACLIIAAVQHHNAFRPLMAVDLFLCLDLFFVIFMNGIIIRAIALFSYLAR